MFYRWRWHWPCWTSVTLWWKHYCVKTLAAEALYNTQAYFLSWARLGFWAMALWQGASTGAEIFYLGRWCRRRCRCHRRVAGARQMPNNHVFKWPLAQAESSSGLLPKLRFSFIDIVLARISCREGSKLNRHNLYFFLANCPLQSKWQQKSCTRTWLFSVLTRTRTRTTTIFCPEKNQDKNQDSSESRHVSPLHWPSPQEYRVKVISHNRVPGGIPTSTLLLVSTDRIFYAQIRGTVLSCWHQTFPHWPEPQEPMMAKANPVTGQAFQESGEGSFHVGKKQNNNQ